VHDGVREEIRAEFEKTRSQFHAILGSLSEADWRAPSGNPAWTNGQLLFHMMFAFMLVPALFFMIRFWSRRPERYSRAFARMLDASTPVFNWINALGPHLGACLYGCRRIGAKYDRVHRAILRRLDALADDEWARGMYYPRRWDPIFGDFMTFEDLFRYPGAHFRHHLRHLSPGGRPDR
jgi:DinB family protein